jgi:uncharacterized protein
VAVTTRRVTNNAYARPSRAYDFFNTRLASREVANSRLIAIDRLRGIALVGVSLVNLMVFAGDAGAGASKNYFDGLVTWLREMTLNGKCYPIMAAVFGYSLGLQLRRAHTMQEDTMQADTMHADTLQADYRVAKRRLIALCVIGLAHSLLLYRYDILLAYGLLGMCAYLLRNVAPKVLCAISAAAFLGGTWLFRTVDLGTLSFVRFQPAEAIERYRHGTYLQLVEVHVANFAANLLHEMVSQWPYVFAMMLLGLLAERYSLLEVIRVRTLHLAIVIAMLAMATAMILDVFVPSATSNFWYILLNPVMSVGAIAFVVRSVRVNPHHRPIDALGQMSLTCYLMQSVVFNALLYGFGFQLARGFRPSVQVAFVAVFVRLQIRWAAWYLSRHQRGPIETLMHRWSTVVQAPVL